MLESILLAVLGGAMIGVAASALLFFSGRISGISGIVGGLLTPTASDFAWRLMFVTGLLTGGVALAMFMPSVFHMPTGRTWTHIAVAGLLVGFGTRMGNGCTSGHGVCGLTRCSHRSIIATMTFMATGFMTATAMGLLFAGGTP